MRVPQVEVELRRVTEKRNAASDANAAVRRRIDSARRESVVFRDLFAKMEVSRLLHMYVGLVAAGCTCEACALHTGEKRKPRRAMVGLGVRCMCEIGGTRG